MEIFKKYNEKCSLKYGLKSWHKVEDKVVIEMVKSMCDIEIPKLLKPYQRQKWKKVDKLLKKLWLLIPSCFVQAMQDTDIALATKCISFEEWWWSLYGMLMVLIHKDRQTKKVLDLIYQICEVMKQGE